MKINNDKIGKIGLKMWKNVLKNVNQCGGPVYDFFSYVLVIKR